MLRVSLGKVLATAMAVGLFGEPGLQGSGGGNSYPYLQSWVLTYLVMA